MSVNFKPNTFVRFYADVFMCQQCHTSNKLSYWHLRLLSQGKLIDAFHWDNLKYPMLQYNEKDSIHVVGCWTTKREKRFQVIQSRIVTSFAANDDNYHPEKPLQLEYDSGDEHKLIED